MKIYNTLAWIKHINAFTYLKVINQPLFPKAKKLTRTDSRSVKKDTRDLSHSLYVG